MTEDRLSDHETASVTGCETTSLAEDSEEKKEGPETKSKYKYGIVYLSYIPDGLNVASVRDIMSNFGEVNRIYLEPDEKNLTSKRNRYTEGWVEFKKKRTAKNVAQTLNGTVLQYGKKHSRVSGQIWSLKYLHRFKWANLQEQLRHDKAVKDQKRRFEMSQTKKQVDFYQRMTERSRQLKRKPQTTKESDFPNSKESMRAKTLQSRQNKPIGQGNELSVPVSEDLLSSIFKKVT